MILNFIIGFLYFFTSSDGISRVVFLSVLAGMDGLFILAMFAGKEIKSASRFLYFHFLFDVMLITFLTYFDSGMIKSDLGLLYYLVIITAGLFFYDRGSVVMATVISVLYITSYILIMNGAIPVYDVFGSRASMSGDPEMAYLRLFINLVMFYITSFVISNLGMAYQKKGEEFDVQKILLDDIFENMSDQIFVFDKNGLLSNWNQKEETVSRVTPKNGMHYEKILPDEVVICLRNVLQHKIASYSDELRTGAKTYTYEINKMKKEDTELGYMVTFSDITKKKELEVRLNELDRLAYLGTLGAGMAHELRNPLASLYGSIELLNEKSFNKSDKKLYGLILKESERLNKIVTDFLDYVKGGNVDFEKLDISQLILETVTMISVLSEKRIVVRGKSRPVNGDPNLLVQTFNNLIWNALEAIEDDGTVAIDIREDENYCIVEVSDNGTGIGKEALSMIFTPFYSDKRSGAGLGLAIVKKNVINMGGKIEVESELKKGTVFRVFLPAYAEK